MIDNINMEEILKKIVSNKDDINKLILCYSLLTQDEIIKRVCKTFKKKHYILKPNEIDKDIKLVNIPIGLYIKNNMNIENFVFCFTDLVTLLLLENELFYDDENIDLYDVTYFNVPKYEINDDEFNIFKQNKNRGLIAEERFKIQMIVNI